MKKIIFLLAFLCSTLAGKAQVISYQGPNPLFSDDQFIIDVAFTFPFNCDRVQATLSFTANNGCTNYENVLIEGGTFFQNGNTSNVFNANPSFNTNNSVTTLTIDGTPGSAANIQINLRTKWGQICRSAFPNIGYPFNSITFTSSVTFSNTNGGTCGTFNTGNLLRYIEAYDQWVVPRPTVQANRCLGGIFEITETLTHPQTYRGVVRLYNPRIYIDLPVNAILHGVIYKGAPLAFSSSNNGGCGSIPNNTVRWAADIPAPNYLQPEASHTIVFKAEFPCEFFQLNTSYRAVVRLSGTDCCSNGKCLVSPARNFTFTSSCCSLVVQQPTLKKTLLQNSEYCPGGCYEEGVLNKNPQYNITFAANNTHLPMTNVVINDNIPSTVDVRKITTPPPPAGATVELWYALNYGALTQYIGNVPRHIFVQTNSQFNCSAPACRVTQLQWRYPSFPAFGTITNSIDFALNNTALTSTPVINEATATYTLNNTSGNLTSTISRKPVACKPAVKLQKFVSDNGSCTYYKSGLPGDEITFRLNAWNSGSANVNNGTITDVLDNIFEIIPSSVKYYYGTLLCPPSAAFSSSFTFPNSVNPVSSAVSGNTLMVSTVNLPSCDLQNKFIIEFKARIKPYTQSGTAQNTFVFTGNNVPSPVTSNAVTVEVNESLLLTANFTVKCAGNGSYQPGITTIPNSNVQYKLEITNAGNIGVETVTIYNIRPRINDENSTCSGGARGTTFNMVYNSVSAAGMLPIEYYTTSNCKACICGGSPCVPSGGVSTMQSMCIRMPQNTQLLPGQTLNVLIDAVVPNNAIGLTAINNCGVVARRVGGAATPVFVSNNATVDVNANGCGGCVVIENESNACVPQSSSSTYSFCIKNNSSFTATEFVVTNTSSFAFANIALPPGVTVTQSGNVHTYSIPSPGLAPGQSLCGFTTQWAAYAGGENICFNLQLNGNNVSCQNPAAHCFTVLNCTNPCADVINPIFGCQEPSPGNFVKFITFNLVNNGLACISQFNIIGGFGAAGLNQTITVNPPIPQGMASGTITVPLPVNATGFMCFSILQAVCNPNNANDPICNGDGFCLNPPPCGPMRQAFETIPSNIMKLTPNPVTNGKLTVTISDSDEIMPVLINIFAIDGRLLQTHSISGTQEKTLDVLSLPPGLYIVKATTNEQVIQTAKFVIE